jgi:hypothetical protein
VKLEEGETVRDSSSITLGFSPRTITSTPAIIVCDASVKLKMEP